MSQAGRHLLRSAAWQQAHTHTHTHRGTHSDTSKHIQQKDTYTHMQILYDHTHKGASIHTPVCIQTHTHTRARRWTRPQMNSQTVPEVTGGKREKRRKEAVSGKLTEETGPELQLEHMQNPS